MDSDKIELYSIFTGSDDSGYYIYVGHKLNDYYFVQFEVNLHEMFVSDYKISPKFSLCYILNNPQIKYENKVISCNNVKIYPNSNIINFTFKKIMSTNKVLNDLKNVIITVSNKVTLDFSLNFNK